MFKTKIVYHRENRRDFFHYQKKQKTKKNAFVSSAHELFITNFLAGVSETRNSHWYHAVGVYIAVVELKDWLNNNRQERFHNAC